MAVPWWMLAAGMGASAAGSYLSQKSANNASAQAQDKNLEAEAAAQQQKTALEESMANPYRQQMAQAGSLQALDLAERGNYTPVQMDFTGSRYGSNVPKLNGGFSYSKSPELTNAAGALKASVLAGQGAPTMTDPANYGKTSALSLGPDGRPAAAPAGANPQMSTANLNTELDAIVNDYQRRGGGTGGVWKGAASGALTGAPWAIGTLGAAPAIGAIAGGIAGAVTKHAKTAPSDFMVDDARAAIARVYQQYQKRTPAPEEVDRVLASQGWKPGSRYVGQQGLMSVLTAIAQGQA